MPILKSKSDQSATHRTLLAICGGIVIGLFFGLPPALGTHSMGLPWIYALAVVAIGLAVGLLMAFTAEAFLPRPDNRPSESEPELDSATSTPRFAVSSTQLRLAERKACLDLLDAQRKACGNSDTEKTKQERIVWGELLDLELQEHDEQMSRIRRSNRSQ